MGSATFIHEFFPDTHALAVKYIPSLLATLYPDALQQQCPTPLLQLQQSWIISTPSLVPLALVGIIVGLLGMLRLQGQPLWRRAFFWFAGMNLSAILCHVLTPSSSAWKPFTRALDVGCTCCSSCYLVLASSSHSPQRSSAVAAKQQQQRYSYLSLDLLSVAVVAFSVYSNHHKLPFVNEALYICTTLAAVATLFLQQVYLPQQPHPGRPWILAATICAGIAASAPLADQHLCRAFGKHINQVHLLFAGCDAAFWCLFKFLTATTPPARVKQL